MEKNDNALQTGAQWSALVRFEGNGLSYFGILLHKWIFSLFTLGIYSFWGKTRARKYLWSQTHILGEALEYTGTGKELFISFLIVMPILTISAAFVVYLGQLFPLVIVAFYAVLLLLWEFASYRALRYRLTRSRWRGIRGNMSGSALDYAWRACLYWLAVICSLGLLLPWASARMTRMKLNNVWFGNRKAAFDGPASELVRSYLICLGGSVLWLAVIGFVFYYINNYIYYIQPDDQQGALIVMALYLAAVFGCVLMFCFYRAVHMRWLCAHLAYGDMRLRSRITGWQVFSLTFTNALLVIFTLGLAWAWALTRALDLYMSHVDYSGDPALDELLQDSREVPTRGEGLLEALDVDISL